MMQKITGFIGAVVLSAAPLMAAAQQFNPTGGPLGTLLGNIIQFVNAVLIPFILGIAFLFFVWGMFKYFIKGGDDEDARKEGKNLIVYALAGFIIIFIFWGVVSLLTTSTGLGQQTLPSGFIPAAPGAGAGAGGS